MAGFAPGQGSGEDAEARKPRDIALFVFDLPSGARGPNLTVIVLIAKGMRRRGNDSITVNLI